MCAGSPLDPAPRRVDQLGPQLRRRGRRCGCTTAGSRRSRAACRRSRRSSPSAASASGSPSRSPLSRSSADHRLAGGERRLAGQLRVRRGRRLAGEPVRRLAGQAAVAADHGADRQVQLAPPGDVGEVAERAAHGDAGALVHLGRAGARRTGISTPKTGEVTVRAEQRLVALVVGVGDQRDARWRSARAGSSRSSTGPPSGRWNATRW